ncbi:MAG: glycoside hydrolase family 71/99-like protein [Verrucomicrobiota bacterium]
MIRFFSLKRLRMMATVPALAAFIGLGSAAWAQEAVPPSVPVPAVPVPVSKPEATAPAAAAAAVPAAATAPAVPAAKTMEGKVYTGYQGWFTPLRKEDGAKWVHFGHRGKFEPGFSSVEMWPDTSELDADEKVETGFRNADGSMAYVFDSQNSKTVSRHFGWMKQYGIDGAFLQRFAGPAASDTQRPHLDRVLASVREGSKTHGVEWGLMYDLSGVRAKDIFPNVSEDWKRLAGEGSGAGDIRSDAHYIHHRGKPVVVLWGVGFNDNRPAPGDYLSLVQFLKNDPVYGGNTVILGVPFYWRTGKNDAVSDPDLEKVILAADVIAPWPVGRYADPNGAASLARRERAPDAEWAAAHGLDYLPGIFPGFSWSNLMKTRRQDGKFNQIPRLGGQFLWTQAVTSRRAGAKMLYVAMFDEIDEGTAIFKVSNTPPAGETPFVTYDGLPSDHYLWLTGEIGKMLRGPVPGTDSMPER